MDVFFLGLRDSDIASELDRYDGTCSYNRADPYEVEDPCAAREGDAEEVFEPAEEIVSQYAEMWWECGKCHVTHFGRTECDVCGNTKAYEAAKKSQEAA